MFFSGMRDEMEVEEGMKLGKGVRNPVELASRARKMVRRMIRVCG